MLTTSELKQWFDAGIPGGNCGLNDAIAEHVLDVWWQIERLVLSGGDLYGRRSEDEMRFIFRRFDEVSLATLKAGASAGLAEMRGRRLRLVASDGTPT